MPALPKTEWTARVVEWHDDKGHGWLQFGDKRVFLHANDYQGRHACPSVSDEVRFVLGQDRAGRPCARRVVPARGGYRVGFLRYALLACLLLLPAVAIHERRTHAVPIVAALCLVSMITFAVYARDKRRARRGDWRIPEFNMHVLELLGGWPGAWVAQPYFRHKCSKASYQVCFFLIIVAHQFAAYDSLQNWRLTRLAAFKIQALEHSREFSPSPMSRAGQPMRVRHGH